MPTAIYTLACPRTGEIRYVGKTAQQPAKRLDQHVARRKNRRTHTSAWIKSLNARPIMDVLMTVDDRLGSAVERRIIATYRSEGYRLTNHTEGGEGTAGYKFTPEQIERLSAAHRGQSRPQSEATKVKLRAIKLGGKHTLQARANMSVGRAGIKLSPQQRAQISERMRGNNYGRDRPWSNERRTAHSERMKGNRWAKGSKGRTGLPHTLDSIAKMKTAAAGRVLSAEHRAKISASLKGRIVTPETREKLRIANTPR